MAEQVVLNESDLFVAESNSLWLWFFRENMTKSRDYEDIHQKKEML